MIWTTGITPQGQARLPSVDELPLAGHGPMASPTRSDRSHLPAVVRLPLDLAGNQTADWLGCKDSGTSPTILKRKRCARLYIQVAPLSFGVLATMAKEREEYGCCDHLPVIGQAAVCTHAPVVSRSGEQASRCPSNRLHSSTFSSAVESLPLQAIS
ncbi:hypothetical protein NL676_038779 [Syzygium grande]|nr:hypothetical protein NL676_038779 [Syzygium grande]